MISKYLVGFSFICTTFSLVSCNKDDIDIHFPNKEFYNIEYNYTVDYIGKTKLEYNSRDIVEYIGNEFFKYDEFGRIIKSYETGIEDTTIYFYDYGYDRIIIDQYSPSGKIKGGRRILFYNKIGECIRQELWYSENLDGNYIFTGNYKEYSWKDRNLIKMNEYWDYSLTSTKDFIYNDNVNPIRTLNNILIPEWAYQTYLSYNLVDTILTSEYSSLGNGKDLFYKYDYSEIGKISRYVYVEQLNDWKFSTSIRLRD